MYRYLIKSFFYSATADRLSLFKLLILRLLLSLLYLILHWFSYVILIVNYQLYLAIHRGILNFFMLIDPLVKDRRNNVEANLKQIFFYKGSDYNLKKLSKESLRRRYYDSLVFHKTFLYLVRRKRFLDISLSMSIKNDSGLSLPYCGTRKIIFCHMHNNDKVASIVKIESLLCTRLTTLYIQRAHSKRLTKFIKSVSQLLGKQEVSTYDPFDRGSTGRDFVKKIKTANIVHTYVDLNSYLSFKNFTTTKINLFGKSASIIDGFARIAISTKAICIPVFVNGDEINLLRSIDTLKLNQTNKTQELIQSIFDTLSPMLLKYPEKWSYLEEAETYYRNIKFKD